MCGNDKKGKSDHEAPFFTVAESSGLLANPGLHQSMKLALPYHFGEIVLLLLRARALMKAQGTCHVKLSSLSDQAPHP
jgi:hypothetical protein